MGDNETPIDVPRPVICSPGHSVENPTFKLPDHRKDDDFLYSSPQAGYQKKINLGYAQN
jgi:hypothetical protein